jgi:methylated-DNA-[protein]-cysteine S-methyltransferase
MNTSDVFYFQFDSPLGLISVFYKNNPFVLVKVVLPGQRGSYGFLKEPSVFRQVDGFPSDRISRFFRAYFNRQPISVPWDLLCLDGFTPLQRLVWEKTAEIAMGQLAGYGCIAKAVGHPGAARFVGTTLGKNPFPIIVPCHRVIRKDGGLGGFGSGLDMKRKLMAFEGSLK